MVSRARTRRRFLKPLALVLGSLVLAARLLIGGWLLWIALRPPPAGFAPTTGQAVAVPDQPAGAVQYTIDARSRKDWVYFSFSRGSAVSTTQDSLDWDLACRRTDNLTNSGETNRDGLGGAVVLGSSPLEDASPPEDGALVDAAYERRGLVHAARPK